MLTFERDGAERFPLAAVEILPEIEAIASGVEPDRAGIRLHGIEGLSALLTPGTAIGGVAAGAIGPAARPVRAILFDKTATANWSLGWHQDRTIVVAERREVEGYGPWTVKAGLQHVAPPFDLLARMVTLRVHLDPVSAENAPLLIAPGSHHAGRVAENDIDTVVAACGVATGSIGPAARPVRAILFDKTATANWSLGWHQDRTIVVARRCEVEGFGSWTVKAGLQHVAPPFELLARMVTLRVHLDPVSADNAPLLIARGSHRAGRVAEQDIDAVVAGCGVVTCLAERGDVWLYATPILHASETAARPQRRRVLQVDYAAEDLPHGLEWLGI